MTEKLLSCATLLSVGLMSNNEYNDILDTLFIKMPEDNSLLALEFVSSDPFFTMCYADDPLSWGDKDQTRELYEQMFRFYDEK